MNRERKTIRAYLNGERTPGVRRRPEGAVDEVARFVPYLRSRLAEDPHVWATALFDEIVELGYSGGYSTLTRRIVELELRPHCEPCAGVKGRVTVEIEHPPGEEIQWDWVDLPDAPWGGTAEMLVGSLPFSGRFRGVLAESKDQPHLIAGMHEVMVRLGGTARCWRVDRMATVIKPGTADVQASFVPVARHYGVTVAPCPPRRGNRKGSVEKSIHYATQRWWRTTTAATMAEAQAGFDRWCARVGDKRKRPLSRIPDDMAGMVEIGGRRPMVFELALLEGLRPLPAMPFPATVTSEVKVGPSATARFEGNAYGVPVALRSQTVVVSHRLGTDTVEIRSPGGIVVATHRLAPKGAGMIVRTPEQQRHLEQTVLDAFTTARPCATKGNRPPGDTSRQEAARLRGETPDAVVVDLAAYQAIVESSGETAR